MAEILADGSVIPGYLGSEEIGTIQSMGEFTSIALMTGEVKEIIYPKDEKSINKQFTEYRVKVQYRHGSGPAVSVDFVNCLMANPLAGKADRLRMTLRADGTDQKDDKVFGTGSKVLILCLYGESSRGYILGGVEETDEKETKENGHNLYFEFNGLSATINNEGQLRVRFGGATKVDGTLSDDADSGASGTYALFSKDGSLTLATKDDAQYIKLNHDDKVIEIKADEHWSVKSNKKITIKCQEAFEMRTEGDKMRLEADKEIYMTSAGVHVGDATDKWPLFSTYRGAEQDMHGDLKSALQSLASDLNQIASNLLQASVFHKIPYTGASMGASSIQSAAQSAASCASDVRNMVSAISTFEGQASKYESKKNRSD